MNVHHANTSHLRCIYDAALGYFSVSLRDNFDHRSESSRSVIKA